MTEQTPDRTSENDRPIASDANGLVPTQPGSTEPTTAPVVRQLDSILAPDRVIPGRPGPERVKVELGIGVALDRPNLASARAAVDVHHEGVTGELRLP